MLPGEVAGGMDVGLGMERQQAEEQISLLQASY